jgi:hypothetical protein
MPAMTPAQRGLTDALSGVVLIIVAGVGLRALAATTAALEGFDIGTDPGPALMPRLLLWALGAGGLWLAGFGGWRFAGARRQLGAGSTGQRSDLTRYTVPVLFALSLVAYVRGLFVAGFAVVTFVFCFAWIVVLTRQIEGQFEWRRALASAGAALAITAVVYYVFHGFVRVPLP